MTEKFISYFGFQSNDEMLKNEASFASNINESLENAWIDFIYRFMRHFKSSNDGGSIYSLSNFEVNKIEVIPPPHKQQKYPEILGKTKFRLPALSFRNEYVIFKETGKKIKNKR